MTRALDRRFFFAAGRGSRPAKNCSSASRLIRHRGLVADRLARLEAGNSPDLIQPITVDGSTRRSLAASGGVRNGGRLLITGALLDRKQTLPLASQAEHFAKQLSSFADLRQFAADVIRRRNGVDGVGDGVFTSANIRKKTMQGIAYSAMLPRRVFGGYGKVQALFGDFSGSASRLFLGMPQVEETRAFLNLSLA